MAEQKQKSKQKQKKVEYVIKLQVAAGQANPSPPIGPALGQRGVNIMEFCKAFNARTQGPSFKQGMKIPVVIRVYSDKSFDFDLKSPPAPVLLLEALGISKGSGTPHTQFVGKVTRQQLEDIVKIKQADLTAISMDAAVRTIAGTARSMGIEVEEGAI